VGTRIAAYWTCPFELRKGIGKRALAAEVFDLTEEMAPEPKATPHVRDRSCCGGIRTS
jgi:hypothetical protein